MRVPLTYATGVAMMLTLVSATAARADFPTYYADPTTFTAAGTILQTVDFEGFGSGLTLLPASQTYGPVTLTGAPLIVVGTDSYLQPVRNVIANNVPVEPLIGDIGPTGFNMFGFQLGNLLAFDAQVFMQLHTNLDSYLYGLYPSEAPEVLTFYGFVVPQGEYFTGFEMSVTDLDQAFGITDLRFGVTGVACNQRICEPTGAIPEPSAWALMITGFGAVGAVLRSRRRGRLSPA